MKLLKWATNLLLVVGGLNLGAVGLLKTNYLESYLGANSQLLQALYIAIGFAAAWKLVKLCLWTCYGCKSGCGCHPCK